MIEMYTGKINCFFFFLLLLTFQQELVMNYSLGWLQKESIEWQITHLLSLKKDKSFEGFETPWDCLEKPAKKNWDFLGKLWREMKTLLNPDTY